MSEQSEFDTERLCQYIPKGDGYNSDFADDLSDAVAFIKQQAAEIAALREFAIWLTGCGYDFTQHQYFLDNRHLLIGYTGESE